MKCARAQDLFSSYAENAMEPPLRVAFEQHLAECQDCMARYKKFNATMMMLGEMPEVEVPAGFHAAVMARVERTATTAPRPVRWWHLDWQRVFTVRVPARALAMGLATVLMAGVVIELTPLNSITANLLFPQKTVSSPVGTTDPEAPKLNSYQPRTYCLDVSESGLAVCVDTSSLNTTQNSYALRFEGKSSEPVKFEVYLLPADSASPDAAGTLFYSGFVQSKQDATVGVAAGENAVVRVSWVQRGRAYRQYVFMPSRFSASAGSKNLRLNATNVFGALRQMSEAYGVVVLASGDLSKRVTYMGGDAQTPADALYGIVQTTGLAWDGIGTCIYQVEPAR